MFAFFQATEKAKAEAEKVASAEASKTKQMESQIADLEKKLAAAVAKVKVT